MVKMVDAPKTTEVLRQISLLAKDTPYRATSIGMVFALSSQFIELPLLLTAAVLYFLAEVFQYRIGKKFQQDHSTQNYLQLLIWALIATTSLLLPVISMWSLGGLFPRTFGIVTLMATFLHVVLVRSPHLLFSALTAIPIITAFYYLCLLHYVETGSVKLLIVSVAGVTTLNAYFLLAVYTFHRFQRSLSMARDSATAASASKSKFLATMSHELRTPLNAIMGVSQLLRDQPQHPASAVRIAALQQASRSLKALVDDVLDLTLIEQGNIELRPIPADLPSEVAAIAELHRPMAFAQGLSFELRLEQSLIRNLTFDPLRVRQCLTNLLNNALKFTQRGTIEVTVRTRNAEGDTVRVEIEVSDTGIGVPPELHRHLFESGFQGLHDPASSQPSHRPIGAGLGLSISRILARQMGGDITLDPKPTPGATFRFTFIARISNPESPLGNDTSQPVLNSPDMNVLVVDDIATNRMVAAAYVEAEGMTAVQAAGGAQALDLLSQTPFDLVLLDMNMPEMSGLETFRAIRNSATDWAAIPVIALTADAMPEDTARYLRAGLDGYLAKPLDKAALRAEIAALNVAQFTRPDRSECGQ